MFTKTRRVESEARPGASYTLLLSTEKDRRVLRRKIAESGVQAKLRRIVAQMNRYDEEFAQSRAAKEAISEEDRMARLALADQYVEEQQASAEPIEICYYVSDVVIDGEPYALMPETVPDLPSRLYDEMLGLIRGIIAFPEKKAKNLPSPTTSSGQGAGGTQTTTATAAGS